MIAGGLNLDALTLTLYNLLFRNSSTPEQLLLARVTMLHKGGGKATDNASNYRPIAVGNILNKCFEKMLQNRLASHLEANSCLVDIVQHGFTYPGPPRELKAQKLSPRRTEYSHTKNISKTKHTTTSESSILYHSQADLPLWY